MKTTFVWLSITVLLFISACTGGGTSGGGAGGGGSGGGNPPATLTIATTTLAQGIIGQAYSADITAAGGSGTGYTWSLISGGLPGGLSLSASGVISGNPASSGTFNFTVEVTDSASATATASLQIQILPAPPLGITTAADMPDGTVGQSYAEPLTAAGGTGTYSWAVIDGEVPPGLSLAAAGTPSTTVSGTPTAFGAFYCTVEVTDSAAATATLDITLIVVVAASADSWPATFDLVPDRGNAAVFTGSRILQFGGEFGASNGGEVLFPGAGTYTSMTTTGAPAARTDHSAVWTGRRMIVFGGRDGSSYHDDGGSYDPVGDTWTGLSSSGAPTARASHTAVWSGTEMIVWGGHDGAFIPFDDGAAYNPATDTWRQLPAVPTGMLGRERHKAVWADTMMIVWGGFDQNGNDLYDGAAYDPATDTWAPVTDTGAPPVQAYHATVVWTGSRLFVWGVEFNPVMQGAEWDPATNTWSGIGTWFNFRRQAASVATTDGVLVWGGLDYYGTFAQNDGEFFDHSIQNWVTVASSPLIGRFNVKAFWTGRQVIVWGGKDFGFAGTNPQSDGAVYQP